MSRSTKEGLKFLDKKKQKEPIGNGLLTKIHDLGHSENPNLKSRKMEDKKPKKRKRCHEKTETLQEYEYRLRDSANKLKGSTIKSEQLKKEMGFKWVYDEKSRSWKQKLI